MKLSIFLGATALILPQTHAYFYGSVYATWPLPEGHKITWFEATTYVPKHSYDIENWSGTNTALKAYIGSSNYPVEPWFVQRPPDWRLWLREELTNPMPYFPNAGYSPSLAEGDIIRTKQRQISQPQNFQIDWSVTPSTNATNEAYQNGSYNTSLPESLQNDPAVQLADLITLRIEASYYWNFGPIVFDDLYMEVDTINTTWCTDPPKKTIYVGADSQAKDVTITLPFAPVAKVMRGNVYSSCNISRVVFTQV